MLVRVTIKKHTITHKDQIVSANYEQSSTLIFKIQKIDKHMKFIIKLFSEITIKSAPVRKRLIKILRKNTRVILKRIDDAIEIHGVWDNLELNTKHNDDTRIAEICDHLSHIPGIAYWLKVAEYNLVSLDDILEKVLNVYTHILEGKTFCVRCRRHGNHHFQSVDVERFVGAGLTLNTQAKRVCLQNPDITIRIDIKHDRFFIVLERGEGLGGYPIGSQESVLSLISGGFDSTVSSFFSIKRGIRTHFCFFQLGGHTHELAVKEIAYYLWNRFGSSHHVKFITIHFEAVVEEILNKIDQAYMGIILKRMMLRAATAVATEMQVSALVTGEAIGQVSSQTLPNLSVIDSVTDMLVLRPLITMDKQTIINNSARIGTEEFARNIPEYCAVISKKPTTRAKKEKVLSEESRFNLNILEQAISERTIVHIQDIVAEDLTIEKIDIFHKTIQDEVIIDIRHHTEQERKPFEKAGHAITSIPFYRLSTEFSKLDKNRYYLLYCDKGVMSKLHAIHLKKEGYSNVGVYDPKR